MPRRPHFYSTIGELEQLVHAKRHDATTLDSVMAELAHRDTDRAELLRSRIKAIQDGLELLLEAPPAMPPEEPLLPELASAGEGAGFASAKHVDGDPVEKSPQRRATDQQGLARHRKAELGNQPEGPAVSKQSSCGASVARSVPSDPPGADCPVAPDQSGRMSSPSTVVSRMLDLIDYVIAAEKDKLKVVTDVGDHHGFHRSHGQLADLPGVSLNRVDGDETAWLHIERLDRRAPPAPSDALLRAWIVLTDDPSSEPRLREHLSAAECAQAGFALEDNTASVTLEDFPNAGAVRAQLDEYFVGAWAAWSQNEAERRKSIALYGLLFALRQAIGAPDGTPQELVCGIGYAVLERQGKRLRYPLLTAPLDIELDPLSLAINLVPRAEARPSIETGPLDALNLAQVDAWQREAGRALSALNDDPLSPFVTETFEPILRQAAAFLDPDARFTSGEGEEPLPLPMPGPELVITGTFGFFQRERRATQLMADLLAFRDLLEAGAADLSIPPALAALFTEPSGEPPHESFPLFRGISSIPGVTSSAGDGADLFFPKPFNAEQVQIAQRLAVRDGVVVQGPPGTGKTHTIANIISHYLATGRRVLVTSQKSPALRVLQEQLPPAIRPLAVSLLDSDREGLRQFRASVELISERLQNLRRSDIKAEIAALEGRIDGLHRSLASIDQKIEHIGRTALRPVKLDGHNLEPVDAAREVLAAGAEASWLEDPIDDRPEHDPLISSKDIGDMREARRTVGDDLVYLGQRLPTPDLLSDPEAILTAHADLVNAARISRDIASGAMWPLADDRPEILAEAASIEQRLVAWSLRREELRTSALPWDATTEQLLATPGDPLLPALRSLEPDAIALAEDHAWFLSRPVDLPEASADDPRFRTVVADLKAGGNGLGVMAGFFARATRTRLASVRLRGKPPASAAGWAAIDRFIDATSRAASLVHSWNHACTGTGLPLLTAPGTAAGREAQQVLDRIDGLAQLHADATSLTDALRQVLPRWPGTIERHHDSSDVLACLRAHLDRARLLAAEETRRTLLAALGSEDTELHRGIRRTVGLIGDETVAANDLREEITGHAQRILHLNALGPTFENIAGISVRIASCGGTKWASRLCTEPTKQVDELCPGDWQKRWRLRRLANWLDASDQSAHLRSLHLERERAEADLAQAYTRVIEQRTWLALKQQASPAVLSALAAYAVAVGRVGRGTGKSANRHRKAARQAADAVKGALPCWIMPHHRVSESLPAELGIFDLVIVDEASQSTLAALPALFRARQILVVGDDKQVSPDNVGLSINHANALAARYLSSQVPMFIEPMRQEASLYELASVIFGGDRLMLREHFRCAAPIIEFSKQQFYDNQLRPLRLSKASERFDPVLIDVRITDGYRKGRGKTNPPEADYIVQELRRIGDDPAYENRSIGVTTLLGTDQAALIYRRIENELGIPFIEKFRIRVGDPAVFQGDERDVMFLSLVATPGNAMALSGLPYEQRFNVATSRARERMFLVRSLDLEHLSPRDNLRRALLEHFRSPFPADAVDPSDARSRCESDFEREMFDALVEHGYFVDTQVRVGWHRIDLVVEGDDDRRLGIECDGDRYHGPEQWPADMERQRTLERAGWRIWRCFASRFVRERDAVLSELIAALEALDIRPRSAAERSRIYTELREWASEPLQSAENSEVQESNDIPDVESLPSAGQAICFEALEQSEEPSSRLVPMDTARQTNSNKKRTSESEIQAAILNLMRDGNVWTNGGLKSAIPRVINLTRDDKQRSSTRPSEEKWEELVNNALTQSGRSNSLYARGLVVNVGHGRHRLSGNAPGQR